MDSTQISKILKNINFFNGVIPRDFLPNHIKEVPAAFIVNTDSSNEKGEHWVALIIFQGKQGEYFDPFGLPPLHSDFINFLNSHCLNWTYNSVGIQHFKSKACGKFCIAYLKARAKGVSFSDYISQFSVNLAKNEEIVNKQWKL